MHNQSRASGPSEGMTLAHQSHKEMYDTNSGSELNNGGGHSVLDIDEELRRNRNG